MLKPCVCVYVYMYVCIACLHVCMYVYTYTYIHDEDIREVPGVACITDKVREARMQWYGHVMRMEDGCCIKRIMNAEVYGRRSRGQQK